MGSETKPWGDTFLDTNDDAIQILSTCPKGLPHENLFF